MTDFEAVGQFNLKFGLPVTGDMTPHVVSDELFLYKYQHLQEELHELLHAQRDRNLPRIADALADLVYVALGTAHAYGIPFDDVFAEVQRANMEKARVDGAGDARSKRGHAWDIVKPEGWRPPDVKGVLQRFVWKRGGVSVP